MLNWIKLLVLAAMMSGCSVFSVSEQAIDRYGEVSPEINPLNVDYNMYKELFASLYQGQLTDEDVIGILVSIEVEYSSVDGNYWKNPRETWNDKSGDCEDYCTLFLGLLKQEGLYDGQTMIVVRPVSGSSLTYHCKVADRRRGIEYELTGGLLEISPLKENRILKEYNYAEVMYQAYEKDRLDWVF